MSSYLGDYVEDDTVYFLWSTNDADGASVTRTTDGTVSVYKDNGLTQSTAGVTGSEDFDSLTGIHSCTIDLSADAFYATGSDYAVVLSAATIDGQTVNAVLAHFSIQNRTNTLISTAIAALNDVSQAEVNAACDTALTDYDAATGTELAAVDGKIDTIDGIVDDILTDTGTTIPNQISGLNNLSSADVNAACDTALTDYDAATGTELAAVDAKIDTIDGNVDSILTDTGTTIPGQLDSMSGATFNTTTDSLEAIRDRGDAAWTTGAGGSAPTVEEIRAEMDSNSTQLAAIVLDTGTTIPAQITSEINDVQADIAALNDPSVADIADGVWDEVLTGATHNIPTSAGRRVRDITSSVILTGTSPNTASINTSTRIQLDTDASVTDGTYDPAVINIIAGTGAGQSRQIFEYDGTNRLAYVNRDWKTIPDNTSEYVLMANSGDTHINEGVAQGGASTTITLNALAASVDDTYNGQIVFIVAGTGADQARRITDYNGTSKVATVSAAWNTTPDTTSVYAVLPGDSVLESAILEDTGTTIPTQISNLENLSAAQVNAEVVDCLNVDTYAEPGQESPTATTTLADKIGYLFKAFRNKKDYSAGSENLYADDGTTVDQTRTVTDDGTTTTKGEWGSGS